MVLVRLVHVAKASWQPELWCEVPASGPSSAVDTSHGPYNREAPTFPDSCVDSNLPLDKFQATPTIARETDACGHADPSITRSAGGTGNEDMVQLPTKSPPLEPKVLDPNTQIKGSEP